MLCHSAPTPEAQLRRGLRQTLMGELVAEHYDHICRVSMFTSNSRLNSLYPALTSGKKANLVWEIQIVQHLSIAVVGEDLLRSAISTILGPASVGTFHLGLIRAAQSRQNISPS